MNSLQLSNRLKIVASYLPKKANFADIGSDHAYLPCYVCLHDEEATAIAGEVNEGPFQSARKEVRQQGLSDRIEVRKGNGLAVIEEKEVSQLTIAGMGATLIATILEEGKRKLTGVHRIIVQPNINAIVLRKWFLENGYELVSEDVIEEEGHFYEVLVADKGASSNPYGVEDMEKELYLGPFLLRDCSEPFIQKWTQEKNKLTRVIGEMKKASQPDQVKINEFTRQLQWIEEVIGNET
ncbi:tRNA (adenine(22)-N(1))-methyltransferase TrmK [Pontibacillus salicampi]|uniref:tRNA (Adenine(22)-N(1))-methyltransferase TrmK n=1 Tax=Pontibacillus salicampi TaxID=1449801 RepID=A0ABV6LJL5_9BACI